jgi:autotransporter-associated beta strand protein
MPGTLPRFSSFSAFQSNLFQFLGKSFGVFLFIFSSLGLSAQTTTWTGAFDFDFQNALNWSPSLPVNGSSVIVAGDVASDITNVPAITLTNLTINGNCTFAAATSGNLLTVTGNFTVATSKTFTLGNVGQRLNFVLSSFGTGTIAGTVFVNSGPTIRYFQNDGDLTITSTGSIIDNGFNPSNFFLGLGATLRIGSVNGITASPTLSGSVQVIGTRDYQVGANYAYVGVANQSVGSGLPSTVSNLIINNTGGTVTLAAPITVSNTLTVSSGTFDIGANNITSVNAISMTGTTINGSGTINLNGNLSTTASGTTATIAPPIALGASNRTFTVANGSQSPDLQMNSVISGAGVGIIKTGSGILTVAGNNSFSGTTQINSGTLRLGSIGSAGNGPLGTTAGNTVVSSGAVLDLNGFNLTNSEALTLNGSGISSNGVLTNSAGNASYSGLITLGSNATIASTSGSLNITNTGTITGSGLTLTLSGTSGGTISSVIGTGGGSLIKNGSGTWSLSGSNTFTGGTTLNAGTLNINNANALGASSGTFTITGGSIDNTSGGLTTANYPMAWNGDFSFVGTNALNLGTGAVSLNANRQVTVNGLNNLTIGGTLNAPLRSLTKAGAGPIVFGSPMTLTSLLVNAGTLIAPSSTITLTGDFSVGAATFNNNGGTVNFTGSTPQAVAGVTYQNINFSGTGQKNASGNILASGNLVNTSVLDVAGFNLAVSGSITNTTGTIRFSGLSNGFALDGTVEYYGPSQTVGAGTYNNLTISQSSGIASLAGATNVNGILRFNSGNLNVGINVLTLGTAATIATASATRFVIASGGGELRKNYSGAGSFTFPIGDNSGITEYSPVTVNFTSGNPSFISASVIDAKHPNNNSPANFLNRYWNITTGATGVATITANYPLASVVGTEASVSGGQLTGTFNQSTNPWIKFPALAGGTLTATAANLIVAQPSAFTGIIGASPVANAGLDQPICNLTTTTIGGTPTATLGAGGYTYLWSPATNLSATNIANPVYTATTPGTTNYVVTVTDANGFVATDNVDVTVNPLPTPSISGANSVCANQTGVAYSTSASGNTFAWTISGGTIIGPSNTNSIVVNWGVAGAGNLQLTETIGATLCAVTTSLPVTINLNPTPSIAGPATACANQTGLVYNTAPNAGRNYAWTVTGGTITAGVGTSSITVTWGSGASGSVNLTETISLTGCSTSATTYAVTINPLPTPSITGSNFVCANQTGLAYSTLATGNTFAWTISGGTIVGPSNTNSVVVNWGLVGSGSLQLTETIGATSCETTTSLPITINPNPTPSISGPATACANQTSLVYNTSPNAGRTYAWNVTGGTITAGAGTNSITVTWGSGASGSVNLTETISLTGCSAIATTYPVTINPLPTPSISGSNSVCTNQTGVTYSTPPSGNSFSWAMIAGGTITSSTTTNSITVDWGAVGTGTLQLTETIGATSCSVTTSLYNVTINSLPAPTVSGANVVCANAANVGYTTPALGGRTYSWNVIGGSITGPSNGNSVLVNWGGAGTGTVEVTEIINATGCAFTTSPYNVTINPNPTPVVSGLVAVCANQTSVTYSTTNVGGNAYSWTVVGGTVTSGASTNSITVDWGGAGSGTVHVQETISATTCSITTANYNVTINPNPTPVISGLTTVCANRTGVVYSTTSNSGRSYLWTISGGSITAGSTTASATVTWGAAGTGTIQVTETIIATGCVTTTSPYSVLKNPNPTPVVSGPNAACVNASGLIYSTPFVSGNTYSWSLPGGGGSITAGGATDQATVTWTGSGARTIRVTETITATGCNVNSSNFNVTVNPNPTPAISGINIVCSGQNGVSYSTPTNAGRNYAWTVAGGAIASGAGTASITVNWAAAGAGTVQLVETVIATGCSTSTPNYNVTINPNPTPSILGLNSVCAGQTGVTYTTANVGGNSYAWSVSGGSITSGVGTNAIVVSWGVAGAGNVTVTETIIATDCAITTSAYPVTVNPNPTPFIVGSNNVCSNQTGVTYSTALVAGGSYTWVVSGGTIVSGAGTNSIQVDWGTTGSGTVQLTETVIASTCSITTPVLNVFINAPPTPAITGISTVCSDQFGVGYSTPSTGNIYFWSVSGGSIASGAGTNAITVNWGSAGTGTINLTEISLSTGCITATSPFNVIINPLPTPTILGNNNVCAGDLNKIYSTPAVAGNTYNWVVTGGSISGSSTNNTVSINWGLAGLGTLQLTQTIFATGCSLITPVYNVNINSLPTPIIAGANTVCANQTSVVYSTTNIVGNTYSWSVVGGSVVAGVGTNSITINWNGAGTGIISLVETTSASGCSTSATPLNVTINPNPSPIIAGNNTVCAFDLGKIYSTPLVIGNNYSWSVSGGTIIGSSTNNTVTINWGAAGTGTLSVVETNPISTCSFTTPVYTVNINSTPTPVVTGSTTVCANAIGVTYSTANVVGDLYGWSVSGGTITSGLGTNSIVVDWGGAGVGTVTLTEVVVASGCSITLPAYSVTINPTPSPLIVGNNTVCANDINKIYSTPFVAGHTYSWVVTGGVISGSSSNNSVTVNWGAAGIGTLTLTETIIATSCSVTTAPYNVNINNLPTPAITGLSTVCALQTGVTYSTLLAPGNSYTWVISGGTITSGLGTNTVTVDWGASGLGSLTLTEAIPSSSCSTTTPVYNVIINPIPSPIISGNNTVCATDQKIYSTPFTVGNTYSWVVTGGIISGSSTNNTVTIDWGGAGLGTLQVTEIAGCPTTTPIYNVNINAIPTPSITGLTSVCANQLGVTYSTPNVVGNTYTWSVVGGAIVSGANTNSIIVNWSPAGAGSVVVTETITSSGCTIATPPTSVIIGPGAIINAGVDAEVCASSIFDLASRGVGNIASGSNFASIAWSGGTGSFSNAAILNPIYTPGVGEFGPVTLTLTATGIGLCPVVIDQMILTVTPLPTAYAGSDEEICEGINFGFFMQGTPANASNFSSILWTKSGGTGTIINANTLSPTYQPSIGETGIITFTLTSTSTGSCVAATDNMVLTITAPPTVAAGSNAEVCQGLAFNFGTRATVATAANFNTITWTGGAGSFSNPNLLSPTYTPGVGETGLITFTLTATGNGSCTTKTSTFTLNITPSATVNAGSNAEVCEGLAFNFGTRGTLAAATNFNTIAWTGGAGTIVNENTMN